jgi:hypothetical protein
MRRAAEQMWRDSVGEKQRDMNAARSQIDYQLFIMRLLKEEHKQLLGLGLSEGTWKDHFEMKLANLKDTIDI